MEMATPAALTTSVSLVVVSDGTIFGGYMREIPAVTVGRLAACVPSRQRTVTARNTGDWFTDARTLLANSIGFTSVTKATLHLLLGRSAGV